MHGHDVHAVHDHPGDAVGGGTIGDVAHGRLHGSRRPLTIKVVLAHEHGGRLENGSHVERFVKGPLVGRAVAEEAGRHPAVVLISTGEGDAERDGRPRRDDAVGTDHAQLQRSDVHGAALAPVVAGGLGEQLRVHELRVAALGDQVTVAPVRRGDVVVRVQGFADADAHGLLATVKMHGPGNARLLHQQRSPLVELADPNHGLEHANHLLFGKIHVGAPENGTWKANDARQPGQTPTRGAAAAQSWNRIPRCMTARVASRSVRFASRTISSTPACA